MIRQEFPAVHVIEAGANLGFTAANNLALRTLLARPDGGPEFILFLNPDTEPQADAIPRLVGFLQEHPAAIAVGPRLLYSDGSQQSSRRRFPTPLTMIWESTPWERLWPRNPWARAYHCADRSADRVQRVGWLVGAALLVRTTAIRQAGLLDERFFMYSEELEWQWRLQWQNPVARHLIDPGASMWKCAVKSGTFLMLWLSIMKEKAANRCHSFAIATFSRAVSCWLACGTVGLPQPSCVV